MFVHTETVTASTAAAVSGAAMPSAVRSSPR